MPNGTYLTFRGCPYLRTFSRVIARGCTSNGSGIGSRSVARGSTRPEPRILGLFVYEGVLLGLLGSAVGALVSLAAVHLVHVHPVHSAFAREIFALAPSMAASDVIFIGAIVLVVAAVASLQPVWKAARMDPITVLRHV